MKIPFYQVDAFTNKVFKGNPAAVCKLESWIDDSVMQNIATENNLSETAFMEIKPPGFMICGGLPPPLKSIFAPMVGIPEDPVTGSAHRTLIPYWAERLSKRVLHAFQLSKRGGELFCENLGDRVGISGHAVLYAKGEIYV